MTVWISYSKSTDNSESDGSYPISMRQDLSKAQKSLYNIPKSYQSE